MLGVLTSTQMTHFSISKGLRMGGKKERRGVKREGSQSRESKAGYKSWRISLPLWGNAWLSSVFPFLCCSLHGNLTCVAPAGLLSSVVYIPCECELQGVDSNPPLRHHQPPRLPLSSCPTPCPPASTYLLITRCLIKRKFSSTSPPERSRRVT